MPLDNGSITELHDADIIELMDGQWPPEDHSQRVAYFQILNKRIESTYGEQTLSAWQLLAAASDLQEIHWATDREEQRQSQSKKRGT